MSDSLIKTLSADNFYPPPLKIQDSLMATKELKSIEDLFKMITKVDNPKFISIPTQSVANCIFVTKDEKLLIAGTMSGEILVWTLNDLSNPPICWTETTSPIKSITSNDNLEIFAGTESGRILKWNFLTNARTDFRGTKNAINSIELSPDGKIFICSTLPYFEIWEDEDSKPILASGHDDEINCIKIAPDGKIYTGSSDQSVRVWEIDEGVVDEIKKNEDAHKSGVVVLEILGNFLVSGDYEGLIIVWNIEDIECLHRLEIGNPILCLCKSVDNRYLFVTTEDTEKRKIFIVNFKNINSEKPYVIKNAHKAGIRSLVYMNKSSRLVSSSEEKVMKIWNFSTSVQEDLYLKINETDSFAGSDDILVYSKNGKIKFCKLPHCTREKNLQSNLEKITKIVLGPNKSMFAHNSPDNTLYVWRPKVLLEPYCKFPHPKKLTFFEFLDNNNIISACIDGNIRIWSLVFQKLDLIFNTENEVNCVKFTEKYFYAGSIDGVITLYRRKDNSLKKRLEYKSEIFSIDVNSENLLAAGGKSGILKLWMWKEMRGKIKPVELTGHKGPIIKVLLKDKLVYTSGSDNTLKIWSGSLNMLYYSIELSENFSDFFIKPNQSDFFFLCPTGIFHLKNPLKSEETVVYPQQYSWLFLKYLKKLFQNKIKIFDEYWKNYMIYPHIINLLYIFIKANHPDLLKQAINQGVKFVQDQSGESPLSVALNWKNFNCADVILKTLSKMKLKKEFGILESIEKCMNKIINSNLSQLPKFFDSLFPVKTNRMILYAQLLKRAPMIIEKKNSKLQEIDFINYEGDKKEQVEFKASIVKFDFEVGTEDSLLLLRSICHSNNPDLFRTVLLKSILKYKWSKVYYILLGEALIFALMLGFLSFLTMHGDTNLYFITFFLLLNLIATARENIQLAESPRKYFKDFWNVLDITRILGTYIFIFLMLYQIQYVFLNQILTSLYWIRAVTYFRIFDRTRYLIRMITETFIDIIPFLLIFFSSTFTFSLLFYIITKSDNFSETFVHTYQLNFNDFSGFMPGGYSESLSPIFWIVFFLSSIMNPIILLNMLIAIMSDTYDRVQDDQVVADCKEMAELIIQAEGMLFWKRNFNKKSFIQRCDYVRHLRTENAEWMGKIRAIKKSISRLQIKAKGNDRKLERMNGKINVKIKELKGINEQISKKVSDMEGTNTSVRSNGSFISNF